MTEPATRTTPSGVDRRDRTSALVVGSLGVFVALTAFTTSLADAPTLGRALQAGPSAQIWILSSMSVGLAASLLVVGVLADDRGRRAVFVGGALLLAAGSVLCAAAQEPVAFVLGRVVEGVGGAALIATSLAMTSFFFPTPAERATAGAVWGASVSAGIATGPFLPGLLDASVSWRAPYVVLAVLGVAVALAGTRLRETYADHRRALDLPGALTFGATMVVLLVALVESRGSSHVAWPVGLLVLAVVLAVAFVLVERRREHPMLDLALFARPDFTATHVAGLATGTGVIAVMSYSASHLTNALGASTLVAAGALAAWSVPSTVFALLARRLPSWLGGLRQLALGLAICTLGQLVLAATAASTSVWWILPGYVVAGVGTGFLNAGLGREAVATAPPGRGGLGSGVNNTARYLGSAIGVTVVGLVATAFADPVDGWRTAGLITAATSAIGAVVVLGLAASSVRRARRGAPA
ncbi:MFS transporter [Solicola sp. PLA-1-18]|uniref:MFS transporter n=1 Tax=Solicola sp. PLA-1-18 TaxID=3380532 RepID=UPI003B77B2C3